MSGSKAAPVLHFTELLARQSAATPDRIAVVDGVQSLTYGQWHTRALDLAARLGGLIRPAARIGLMFDEHGWTDFAVAYVGVLLSGGTAVQIPADLPPAELDRRAKQVGITGVLTGDDFVPERFPRWVELPMPDPTASLPTAPADAIAEIVYSSGTTGAAKPTLVPHSNLVGPAGDPTEESAPPPVTVAALRMGLASSSMLGMTLGARASQLVLTGPDDVEEISTLVERYQAARVMISPWVALRMVRARVHERHDLGSVRTWMIGSAPLPGRVGRQLLEMTPGAEISIGYSASQARPAAVWGTYDPDRPRQVGRPTPRSHILITDEDGVEVPAGQVGRIWLRSDDAPPRLSIADEVMPPDHLRGWTDTGDLGVLDSQGMLTFFDRAADAIRTADGLVSSVEVEFALMEHPAVVEATAIGLPTWPPGAYLVTAVLVLDDSVPVERREDVASEVLDYSRAFLADHAVPRNVQVVDRLPRNPLGKIDKARLRSLAAPGEQAVHALQN